MQLFSWKDRFWDRNKERTAGRDTECVEGAEEPERDVGREKMTKDFKVIGHGSMGSPGPHLPPCHAFCSSLQATLLSHALW